MSLMWQWIVARVARLRKTLTERELTGRMCPSGRSSLLIFWSRVRIRKCEGCEARQQTIRILADMIDWHRSQMSPHGQSASMAAEPPKFVNPPRNHMLEEEEDVLAALENGAIGTEEAERALAAIQAFNTDIQIAR